MRFEDKNGPINRGDTGGSSGSCTKSLSRTSANRLGIVHAVEDMNGPINRGDTGGSSGSCTRSLSRTSANRLGIVM